ncbi:MAG: ATP-dependent DNA helicase RecG [Candidatus Magasanikbacteria bacterium GW2011_GWC2_41_17]|uniref:Probable DNA 3'-5' helicase RecG n=1 Tax=Candidatus Magasanikbacteria bacterium GW2011_GWC2_41_17 TaxID=1619048 RepID=A0A0G0VIQ6_9BACT|nr:MAG: ATP-dependent DNA helicase RecG [Candidatus Magasanikbacteria bacterium GW2011_GWC2_41_17]
MVSLSTPLSQFPTVKKSLLKKLSSLGLRSAQDLLFYFPFRYDDFSHIVPINQLQSESRVTVRGRLQLIAHKRGSFQRRLITEAMLADNTGQLRAVWFNQPYIAKVLQVGDKLSLAGKVELSRFGLQMVNPTFEKVKVDGVSVHTGRLVPIYPTTAGVTQKQLRFLISKALLAASQCEEWLSQDIIRVNNFSTLPVALQEIHFPSGGVKSDHARERFQFEELFLIQLKNELARREWRGCSALPVIFQEKETKDFVAGLGFTMTDDQRRSAWEILKDMSGNQPMNRLLNGDVGSGKTVVALTAIYNTTLNHFQSAWLAPTEILAQQHFATACSLFDGRGVRVGLLTGSVAKINDKENEDCPKKKFLSEAVAGKIDLVIGTHALIGDKVHFSNLALAIVDEQHRFGVEQRRLLRVKSANGSVPHFLSMTATPIPRSYSLALFGDLDLSLIKQMPVGRRKIITRLVEEINRHKAYDFIRAQVGQRRQIFVICPLIEEKEAESGRQLILMEKKSVLAEYKKLSEEIFFDLRVNFLHGKMKSKEKETVMRDFLNKKIDILVSTSVVEVGVDIPNASVMMIEGAERFGLAQLHQFRGRVGRSVHQSYCLLFTNAVSDLSKKRLGYFVNTADGFELAEKDLELRGPGEVFGETQHGFPELKIATLQNLELIKKSREAARQIIDSDPTLAKFSLLRKKLVEWERGVHLE